MFDPKTVSEMLDIPGSTLRRYCADYGQYLSDSARRSGRKRVFTDADIVVLRRIRKYVSQRKTPYEIDQLLKLPEEDTGSKALAAFPQVQQEFENLRAQLARLETGQDATKTELQKFNERLLALEEYYRQPWFIRLFRKPPQ